MPLTLGSAHNPSSSSHSVLGWPGLWAALSFSFYLIFLEFVGLEISVPPLYPFVHPTIRLKVGVLMALIGLNFAYVAICRLVIRDIRCKLHDNPLSTHKGNPSYGTDRQHQYPAW